MENLKENVNVQEGESGSDVETSDVVSGHKFSKKSEREDQVMWMLQSLMNEMNINKESMNEMKEESRSLRVSMNEMNLKHESMNEKLEKNNESINELKLDVNVSMNEMKESNESFKLIIDEKFKKNNESMNEKFNLLNGKIDKSSGNLEMKLEKGLINIREEFARDYGEPMKKLEASVNCLNEKLEQKCVDLTRECSAKTEYIAQGLSQIGGQVHNLRESHEVLEEKCVQLDTRMHGCERVVCEVQCEQTIMNEKLESMNEVCKSQAESNCKEMKEIKKKVTELKQEILQDVDKKIKKGAKGNNCGKEVSFEDQCRNRELVFENYRKHDPSRFIKQFKQICEELGIRWGDIEFNLSKVLVGEAGCWFAMNQRNIKELSDFEESFKTNFCGDTYRNYLLDLLTGNYGKFYFLTPIGYLTNLANRLIELEMFNETAICQRFARHFGNKFYWLCVSRKVEKLSELIDILNLFEKRDIIADMRAEPSVGIENIQVGNYNNRGTGNNNNEGRENFRPQYRDNTGNNQYKTDNPGVGNQTKYNSQNGKPYNKEGASRENTYYQHRKEQSWGDHGGSPGYKNYYKGGYYGNKSHNTRPYDRGPQVNHIQVYTEAEKAQQNTGSAENNTENKGVEYRAEL